jgi:hypothetical protein
VDCTLDDALGKVLAAPVVLGWDLPPADNSAMDGFAFAFAGQDAGAELGVGGYIPAGAHLYRLANLATVDAVAVAVEVHQRDRRDPGDALGVAVKETRELQQMRSLPLERLPDTLAGVLGVALRADVGQALLAQPVVEVHQGGELGHRGEEAPADRLHLILHLPLLPAAAGVQATGSNKATIPDDSAFSRNGLRQIAAINFQM